MKSFRWTWLFEPPVLIAVFLPAAILMSREPSLRLYWYAGGVLIGIRTGCWVTARIWPNSNIVEAPPLFTLFWLLVIFCELMWILFA